MVWDLGEVILLPVLGVWGAVVRAVDEPVVVMMTTIDAADSLLTIEIDDGGLQ